MATNFEPHKYVIFVQSMKIGTHQNKAIHSTTQAAGNGSEEMQSRVQEIWKYPLYYHYVHCLCDHSKKCTVRLSYVKHVLNVCYKRYIKHMNQAPDVKRMFFTIHYTRFEL